MCIKLTFILTEIEVGDFMCVFYSCERLKTQEPTEIAGQEMINITSRKRRIQTFFNIFNCAAKIKTSLKQRVDIKEIDEISKVLMASSVSTDAWNLKNSSLSSIPIS